MYSLLQIEKLTETSSFRWREQRQCCHVKLLVGKNSLLGEWSEVIVASFHIFRHTKSSRTP